MRAAVLERDGHRCRWPGCEETAETCVLEVHHTFSIEAFPQFAEDLDKQITYCPTHHLQAARADRANTERTQP